MKTETIDKILDIGVSIMSKKGYHSVGLNEILKAANIPKGSFYYYFKSKEDFGSKVISHYADNASEYMKELLTDANVSPKKRLLNLFKDREKEYVTDGFRSGCLMGNCSNELAGSMPNIQLLLNAKFDVWQNIIADCIREGQEKGEFKMAIDPIQMSHFILNNWEGALLRMKATKSIKPFQLFVELSIETLI